jgi:hypothetical protein
MLVMTSLAELLQSAKYQLEDALASVQIALDRATNGVSSVASSAVPLVPAVALPAPSAVSGARRSTTSAAPQPPTDWTAALSSVSSRIPPPAAQTPSSISRH